MEGGGGGGSRGRGVFPGATLYLFLQCFPKGTQSNPGAKITAGPLHLLG